MCRPAPTQKIVNYPICKDPEIGFFVALLTYVSYAVLIAFGHLRDFVGALLNNSRYFNKSREGYAVLLKSWESFYTRRLYHRIQDCWNRPICSSPGARIDVMERISIDGNCTLKTTGSTKSCLNLGSYNYLGDYYFSYILQNFSNFLSRKSMLLKALLTIGRPLVNQMSWLRSTNGQLACAPLVSI